MAKKRGKKAVNGIVKDTVAEVLLENADQTAPEIKKETEKRLKKKGFNYKYTDRTYLKIKNELMPNLGENELDKPWSIGACLKYNIPVTVIPLLLYEVQSIKTQKPFRDSLYEAVGLTSQDDDVLTIREARWIGYLYPYISTLVKEQYPDDPTALYRCLHIKAKQYSHREQIAKITGKKYPNTTDLDDQLDDLSDEALADGIYDAVFTSEDKEEKAKWIAELEFTDKEKREAIRRGLNDKEIELLQSWYRAHLTGAIYQREWEKEHPEIIELQAKIKKNGGGTQ